MRECTRCGSSSEVRDERGQCPECAALADNSGGFEHWMICQYYASSPELMDRNWYICPVIWNGYDPPELSTPAAFNEHNGYARASDAADALANYLRSGI